MNSSWHRCMNQASASEAQTQQRSLNSCLGDTVGSPLDHLAGQLLNGSTSIHPNASLPFTSVIHGPWRITFAPSWMLDNPILPCMVIFYHGGTRKVHKNSRFENASTLDPKANDHAFLEVE
ncbi:hypothetical protein TNCV_2142491 [Trichonephila clavipes]|nr:hypothetical protein TNCV_2142491 [Trichonephila clavipes]